MDGESPLTRSDLLSCLELSKALTAELDSKRLFRTILLTVSALLPAEHWSLLLLDEATGKLRFEISVELDLEMLKDIRLSLGEGIAGQVALQQEPMIVADVRKCEFFTDLVDQHSSFTTHSIILCTCNLWGTDSGSNRSRQSQQPWCQSGGIGQTHRRLYGHRC